MRNRRHVQCGAAVLAVGLLFNAAMVFASPLELSLTDSVMLALKNNPAIKMADADKDKSQWGVDEAGAGRIPNLSLGTTYNLKNSSPGGGSDLNNNLRLNWQLYSGGRIQGQIDQARQGVKVADLAIEKAKEQVKLDTITAYFNVLQTKNMAAVNQETVNNLREHLQTVQAKYHAGVVAKSDVLRAEVELANAEQNMIRAQNSYDLAAASLKNMMSVEQNAELVLKDELKYTKYEKSLDECLVFAENNRPEIAQADVSIQIANDGIKIAESGKLPSVSANASTGWSGSLLPENNNNWSVGLSANWSLFDAGVNQAKTKQATATLNKVMEQAKQTQNSVALEVRQSYLGMQEAEKRLESTEVATHKAQEDLTIAREKYNAGVGTNLDVIDAQLALTQAKTNHVQALYDFNTGVAKIDKAIGVKAE